MTYLMTLVGATLAAAFAAPGPSRLPPELPPSIRDLPSAEPPPAIFTYTVDGECDVDETRKLQGPAHATWSMAGDHHDVFRETTVWRFVDGARRQLIERRVRLLGEMILEGELVCHVEPAGGVVEAWIERRDPATARRQRLEREPVPLQNGEIEPLGTFSVELPAEVTEPPTNRPAP